MNKSGITLFSYDPSQVGVKNSGIFGLPHGAAEASVLLIPVPWDVTTSYCAGAAAGAHIIRDASSQIDLYHPDFPDLWKYGVFMPAISPEWHKKNKDLRPKAEAIIEALETNTPLSDALQKDREEINESSESLNRWVFHQASAGLNAGKVVGLVGGDHSTPLGMIQALAMHHDSFGILHIDAHLDLRDAYMGFTHSHASIMHNAMKMPQITRLVQVGIRDYCEPEARKIAEDAKRYHPFYDKTLKENAFCGKNWHDQCEEIIASLPDYVYISFDIDGLAPHLCPNTGTPVPGGLSFEEAIYLIKRTSQTRKIIGFDVVEVAGDAQSIDANVGARLVWHLCGYALNTHPSHSHSL